MKVFRFTIVLILLFTFFNCSKNESSSVDRMPENSDEIYFSLNAENSYDTSETDNWIIISTDSGMVLDYKSFEGGDELNFETEASNLTDQVSITFLSVSEYGGGTFYGLVTYPNIEKGSVWNLRIFPNTNTADMRGANLGESAITVSNVPEIVLSNVSNMYGPSVIGGSSTTTNGLTNATFNYTVFENTDEQLLTIVDGTRASKYFFFKESQVDQEIGIDYSQFSDFDTTLEVNVPANSNTFFSMVLGFEDNQEIGEGGGFFLNQVLPFDFADLNQNPVRLGYLDRFEKYLTRVNFKIDTKTSYVYKNYGAKPNGFSIPENNTFTINDASLENFDFSTVIDYKRRESTWRVASGEANVDFKATIWSTHSQNDAHSPLIQLPEEITMMYPEIDTDNLIYAGSRLHLDFGWYQDFINQKFVEPVSNNFSEEYLRIDN